MESRGHRGQCKVSRETCRERRIMNSGPNSGQYHQSTQSRKEKELDSTLRFTDNDPNTVAIKLMVAQSRRKSL